jgi:hypothetical protein
MSWPRGCLGLVVAAGAIAAAAWLGLRQAPAASTVWHQNGVQRLHAVAPVGPDQPRAWRMQLRLDPGLRQPGPSWAMSEGRSGATGYELIWQAEARTLLLLRGGGAPLLLGSTELPRQPHTVVLARRGARIQAIIDDLPVLSCLDPDEDRVRLDLGGSDRETTGWTFQAASEMGSSSLSIVSDTTAADGADISKLDADPAGWEQPGNRLRLAPAPAWSERRPDHALLCVRRCLAAGTHRDAVLLLGEAVRAVARLPTNHPDHATLALWLAYAEARLAIALTGRGEGDDPGWAEQAVANLGQAVNARPNPTGPGLLLALLPDLAGLALYREGIPQPIDDVLDRRDRWLRLMQSVARSVPRLPTDLHQHLELLAHACGCLMRLDPDGRDPDTSPLPPQAPTWMSVRWRALAGSPDPRSAEQRSTVPPWPSDPFVRLPLLPVLERLIASAGIEPLAQAAAIASLRAGEAVTGAATGLDPDQQALAELLAQLHQLSAARARRDSDAIADITKRLREQLAAEARFADTSPLVRSNPLAFALAQLARARVGGRPTAPQQLPGREGDLVGADLLRRDDFAQLRPFAFLLGGSPDATALVWLQADHVLPPARALAAALAMQEVRGMADVPWHLLYRVPCLTLPLEFLAPVTPTTAPEAPRPVIPLP